MLSLLMVVGLVVPAFVLGLASTPGNAEQGPLSPHALIGRTAPSPATLLPIVQEETSRRPLGGSVNDIGTQHPSLGTKPCSNVLSVNTRRTRAQ